MATKAIPVLRVWDYDTTINFYINWLGFKIDWKEKPDEGPFQMQISMNEVTMQLVQFTLNKEKLGTWVLIQDFKNLIAYRKLLSFKGSKFPIPPIKQQPGEKRKILSITFIDPFQNRIEIRETFGEKN